ncbi:phage major capsid protein [Thiohalobacter thiocyanaticus]|uniref:phage major capsid protein n=1 Tax=Thiohalobacter thiocyanaticus TaxID=585455 RepID=UPI00131A32E2|nr:phage major capsid protein [Thiohalobacter thiocyanaticus]
MNIKSLIQQRNEVVARATAILDTADADDRELTTDEQREYDAAVSKTQEINQQIEAERAKPQSPRFEDGAVPVHLVQQDGDRPIFQRTQPSAEPPGDAGTPRIEAAMPRVSLKSFSNNLQGRNAAYAAGQWLKATLLQDSQAYTWCQSHGLHPDIMAASGTSPNTAGGALVPTELDNAIIDLREQYGLARRIMRVLPMTSNAVDIPRSTGKLAAHFVGENSSGTESDASWDNVQLNAKKLMVLTRMSSEISEDAIITLADWFASDIAYAFALKEDECAFLGDGTSTYGGMTGALVKAVDGSHGKAKVQAASGHDTLGEIDSDDLIKLMAVVPKYAKPGSRWYCSPTAEELVFNAIKVGAGGNTRNTLGDSDMPMFLGYPIEVTDLMADDAAATYNDSVMVAFGNLEQAATLGDRRGIRVQSTADKYWEEDQIGVKGTERFDINVHDLGSDSRKSPFAVLVGQS